MHNILIFCPSYAFLLKGHGKLKQIIDKIETIEQERLESTDLLKDAFNEAKSMGFDVKIIKHVLKLRKKDKKKLEEEDSLIELYRTALQI
ncbi:DUF2312 domain-containing protein (plasmid) [Candidatus Megaera polyxenophila]|nr:DUF2312 domain-containing protein [Candidatus Megaera polyxenophila]